MNVARAYDREVTSIKRRKLCDAEPFAQRQNSSVSRPQRQIFVDQYQLSSTPIILVNDINRMKHVVR